MNNNIKFIFFGTPEVAFRTLEILKNHNFVPSLIVTAPDKPQGRKMLLTPPPVKIWAIENQIPFLQPQKLDQEFLNELKNIAVFEVAIVVAYGKIFSQEFIDLPLNGTLNIHYSLLPKYRGAAPVQFALLNGEKETGVTIQKMALELDSGPIIVQEKIVINEKEKTVELLDRLINLGAESLIKVLPDYLAGKTVLVEQNHSQATFAPKIKKEDGLIDLNDNPEKNFNKFRAFHLWPRVYFFQNNKRVIITDADLVDKQFIIKKVLLEGKKEIIYKEFLKSFNQKNL